MFEHSPSVVQRFGNVKRLITQTLDPILTAFFRDVAQKKLDARFVSKERSYSAAATEELGNRFKVYDINCIAVLIGRPESQKKDAPDDPIDRLFDQLRLRRLADEQKATYIHVYARRGEAAVTGTSRPAETRSTDFCQLC